MKKVFLLLSFFMSSFAIFAQGVDEVTLVVSGEAATKNDATTAALRSAIEQAYGVFVSANTEILNDELVKDEIVTVSSGNVKSYKELGCAMTADSSLYMVSLEAVVSVKQLAQYAASKGASCELAGATFVQNVKLKELNNKNREIAYENMFKQLEAIAPTIYDYEIVVSEPTQVYGGAEIGITVKALFNKNFYEFFKIIESTTSSLGKSSSFYIDYQDKFNDLFCKALTNFEVLDNNGTSQYPPCLTENSYKAYLLDGYHVSEWGDPLGERSRAGVARFDDFSGLEKGMKKYRKIYLEDSVNYTKRYEYFVSRCGGNYDMGKPMVVLEKTEDFKNYKLNPYTASPYELYDGKLVYPTNLNGMLKAYEKKHAPKEDSADSKGANSKKKSDKTFKKMLSDNIAILNMGNTDLTIFNVTYTVFFPMEKLSTLTGFTVERKSTEFK